MNIYFIQYTAAPIAGSENEEEFGGAMINGWIKAKTISDAKSIYAISVRDYGWEPVELEEAFEVSDSFYKPDEEGYEYYQQAKIDGEVYFVHSWPNEPQENERYQ